MKTLEIHIPDEIAAKIEQAANDMGISVDQLLQTSVEEKIQRNAELPSCREDLSGSSLR